MRYSTQVTRKPALPVTIEEARIRCRQVSQLNDPLLTQFMTEECARAERVTGLYLMPQAVLLTLDELTVSGHSEFLDDEVIYLAGPARSITSVKYDADTDGSETTLDPTLYRLDANGSKGRLQPASGETWPDVLWQTGSVRITYEAGFASIDDVPAEIKGRILDAVGYRFDMGPAFDPEFLDSIFTSLYCGAY